MTAQTKPTSRHRFLMDEAGNKTDVVIPVAEYEAMLEALEDAEDIRTARARRDEATVPLEDVLEELKQITVKFDPDGDLIVIQFCSPYKSQGSTEIASGVVARTNPITGRIESLEIMDVSTRDGKLEMPMMIEPELEMSGDD
jgi:hypothetical protein